MSLGYEPMEKFHTLNFFIKYFQLKNNISRREPIAKELRVSSIILILIHKFFLTHLHVSYIVIYVFYIYKLKEYSK